MPTTDIAAILADIKNNPFARTSGSFSMELNDFLVEFAVNLDRNSAKDNPIYGKHTKALTSDEAGQVITQINRFVPAFQRDNDKWDEARQSSYLWNLLRGNRGQAIVLYIVDSDPYRKWILDGLQRVTAINRFLTDASFSVKSPQGPFTCAELRASTKGERVPSTGCVEVTKIHFATHKDACRHYIDINRGITHSAADIARAEAFLARD